MYKLIDAFLADPTDRNRNKLAAYLAKHEMASVLITLADRTKLANAGFTI